MQPFNRLLTFFASRSTSKDRSIITFSDSLKADLSLGLNLPIALCLALARHAVFATGPPVHSDLVNASRTTEPTTSLTKSNQKNISLPFYNPLAWTIHVPSVQSSRKLLGGPGSLLNVDVSKRYSLRQLWELVSKHRSSQVAQSTWLSTEMRLDSISLWALAADSDGRVSGQEILDFQTGQVMESIAERRKGRGNVLPFWRGGPLWSVEMCYELRNEQADDG